MIQTSPHNPILTDTLTRRHFVRSILAAVATGLLLPETGRGAPAKRPLPSVDLQFLKEHVDFKKRSLWTSALPRTWQIREAAPFERITLHHQGTGIARSRHENAIAAEIDAVFGGHRRKGFGDIGYHFVIDHDGRVWEGRSLAYEGAHVSGQNEGNIGILTLGNFESQQPSAAAISAIRQLTRRLQSHFRIEASRLYGHRDLSASLCPGNHLYHRIQAIREA